MRKKVYGAAFAAALSVCVLASCAPSSEEGVADCNIKAAAVAADGAAVKLCDDLESGAAANVDVSGIGADADVGGYDILYLDGSLAEDAAFDAAKIESYVYDGGAVVVDNALAQSFSAEFLGAAEVVALDGCPVQMTYPNSDSSLTRISELLYDFTYAFSNYADYDSYAELDYGVGIVPDTAVVIGEYNGCGVYTMNRYGSGYVFLTNPLLPGKYMVSDLEEGAEGEPLAFSTSGAQRLLLSYYAEYISMEKYGFAAERTFGSFGSKIAAWELHYEDISGAANGSLEEFSRRCMEKGQMPSYTLTRNMYTWFKRAESVTYLKSDGEKFVTDPYEGVYCSGTHIASAGEWLELDCYDKTESYFDDDPQYTKRAYPCPFDRNNDGNVDFLCGSADGKIYYYEGYGMGANYEMSAATYLTDGDGNALSVGAYSSPALCDIDGDGTDEIISGSEDGVIYAFHSLADESNPNSLAYEPMGEVFATDLADSMVSSGDITGDGVADLAIGSRWGEMRVYPGMLTETGEIEFGDYIPVSSEQSWASPCIYNGDLYGGTLEGFVAEYVYSGGEFVLDGYLETDDISRRGDNRITIGMNSVPRFADIDGDGNADLICGALEYGMAYPIDSEYFPYGEQLREQLEFCKKYNIYVGVHSYTHKYATPEHEARELDMHKTAFEKYGINWDGVGANQHTWFTSRHGYDGSGINGYNPAYDGTFAAQYESGLLWNDGSALPESGAVPQTCAENAIPMPMYMADKDFLLLETSNTPHGKGEYSYISVKYGMPMLFYNHCDYMYSAPDEQYEAIDKVGELTEKYGYMFVSEEQMAKEVSAAYNMRITAQKRGDEITVRAEAADTSRRLYDKKYTDSLSIRVIFKDETEAAGYGSDSSVTAREGSSICASADGGVLRLTPGGGDAEVEQVNIPAKVGGDGTSVKFLEDGLMCVRVRGAATAKSSGWTSFEKDGDTVFMKFGKAQTLKIKYD